MKQNDNMMETWAQGVCSGQVRFKLCCFRATLL